ncbi:MULTISPECIES: EF-P lysine aminoacylase EpmA [unclassified Acinetobacter]|uniref:EF-P lysine aminoacylase EpmA n=1 Tax=unclassified Acinetobacter TaxID=196816 RepID=UPI0035B93C3D
MPISTTSSWQPTCTMQALQARAKLYQQLRQFFAERDVLEVETPLLSQSATTDVHLASISAQRYVGGQLRTDYLHTSPEFAMKRLLASGSGAIYQICKVFRNDEHGRKHNSEFTMLEWYRPDFSLDDLMSEVKKLLQLTVNADIFIEKKSYKQVFQQFLGINPLTADAATLKQKAIEHDLDIDLGDDRLAYMDLLFSHIIEPTLGFDGAVFLTDFPPELASLAKIHDDQDGEQVASRFELYINGLELANAYDELVDSDTLQKRFLQDNAERERLGLAVMPLDIRLLLALPNMPACSGIALGMDRLLMVITGAKELSEVISFPAEMA